MQSMIVESCLTRAQNAMYMSFNEGAEESPCAARIVAIPVAIADALLQGLKIPLTIIERVAFALINLFGAAFSTKCTVKDALQHFEGMLIQPVRAVVLPFKLIYKIIANLYNPAYAQSMTDSLGIGRPDFPVIFQVYYDLNDERRDKHPTYLTNKEIFAWFGISTPTPVVSRI